MLGAVFKPVIVWLLFLFLLILLSPHKSHKLGFYCHFCLYLEDVNQNGKIRKYSVSEKTWTNRNNFVNLVWPANIKIKWLTSCFPSEPTNNKLRDWLNQIWYNTLDIPRDGSNSWRRALHFPLVDVHHSCFFFLLMVSPPFLLWQPSYTTTSNPTYTAQSSLTD